MTFIDIAKEFLKLVTGQLDEYTERNGEIKVDSEYSVTLFTPSHIQFAKYGRGPGKNPPLDSILEFVSKKGIIFDGTDERGTAFAIQASIAKKGTANWVPNAPNAIEEAIQNELKKYNEKLAEMILIETNAEVQEIYKEVFPSEIEFKI